MGGIGREVAEEHTECFPLWPLLFDVGAGMEPGIVEHYDGQLIPGSVTGEFIDEGEHMGAFDTFLDQLEVKPTLTLTPRQRADEVEPAMTTPAQGDAEVILRAPSRPGVTHRQCQREADLVQIKER
jgi:hypothetical protein